MPKNKYLKYFIYFCLSLAVVFTLAVPYILARNAGQAIGEAYADWKYPDIPYRIKGTKNEPTTYEVAREIIRQSEAVGFNASTALRIASCESHLRYNALNASGAAGVYQFKPRTWEVYCEGSVMNYKDNIACFLELYPKHPSWWECR